MSGRLINKVATRRFILMMANSRENDMPETYTDSNGKVWNYGRAGKNLKKFTSVSKEFIDDLDHEFRRLIADKIKANPPRGKTVK